MKKTEGEFNFWQDHSDNYLVMAYLWDKRKAMELPDGYGSKTGDCGDTITIYLRIKDDTIQLINFELEGCINTSACCNALAHFVEGKKVEESWNITPQDLIAYLETLPEDHHHCAELAIGTFYLALADFGAKKK